MRLFPLLFALVYPLSFLFFDVYATPRNQTIDDGLGDLVTGAQVQYLPQTIGNTVNTSLPFWYTQQCTTCPAGPDKGLSFNNTWTEIAYNASEVDQVYSISFSFNGTAVYVYFILPNNKLQPVGITRKTLCNFVMDDELIGTFEHDSDGSEVYQYNTLVYANTTIPDGEHTMVLQMPVLVLPADELAMTRLNVIFDRAVYTTTQDNSTESTKKKKPVGGIIAGVVGSLVVVAHLIGLAFWLRKRRRRQRHTIAEKAPPAHQNENDSFLPRAFDIDRSSTIPSMGRFKSDPLATSPVRASHASASEDFDPYADSDSASRTVGDTGRSPVGSGEWRLDMNGFQYVTVAGGSRTATATARRPSSELLFDNSTVTSSSGSVSPPPSKRRAGTAQGRPVSKSTQSSSTTGSSTPLFQHRDSGLRVSEAAVVEEIPPEYSAG